MSDDVIKESVANEYNAVPSPSPSPFAALADELYRERVLRARQTLPEEKILAGQQLFDYACEITLAGIRNQFPGQTEEQNREILRQRLAMRRKWQAKP